jgi:hypothetical protein
MQSVEIDPVVVLIDAEPVGDFRDWLATLQPLEPVDATVSGAAAVRELRDEAER